jgi:hypothetical protein
MVRLLVPLLVASGLVVPGALVAWALLGSSVWPLLVLLKFTLMLAPMAIWRVLDYLDFRREQETNPKPRTAWERTYLYAPLLPSKRRNPPAWLFLFSVIWFLAIFVLPFP